MMRRARNVRGQNHRLIEEARVVTRADKMVEELKVPGGRANFLIRGGRWKAAHAIAGVSCALLA